MLYNASFCQDVSCLAICEANGYRIFSCSPFGQFHSGGSGAIGEVEMLFTTSLIVLVGQGDDPSFSPRSIRVVNTKTESIICQLNYPTSVLQVLLNRERLVVVLESRLYIYEIKTMRLLHTIDTVYNPKGIADLTPNSGAGMLVYPSGQIGPGGSQRQHSAGSPGGGDTRLLDLAPTEITMFDCDAMMPSNIIQAHKGPIAVIKLNSDGTLIATASDRGTIIRIFSVPAGTLLYELRRGSLNSQIYSLAFNLPSTLVAVASATQTVHIFKLGSGTTPRAQTAATQTKKTQDADLEFQAESTVQLKRLGTSYTSMLKKRVTKAKGLLPSQMSNMLDGASRDFASFKVPCRPGTEIVVALPPLLNVVYAVSLDGSFFQYDLSPQGGICKRSAEYSLL